MKPLALAAFVFYLGWNVIYISQGLIPPSIFSRFTGLPCPTTGCIRSLEALVAGEWSSAFYYNPFTLVFIGLFLSSLFSIIFNLWKIKSPNISLALTWMWVIFLGISWVSKFFIGEKYW